MFSMWHVNGRDPRGFGGLEEGGVLVGGVMCGQLDRACF